MKPTRHELVEQLASEFKRLRSDGMSESDAVKRVLVLATAKTKCSSCKHYRAGITRKSGSLDDFSI